MRSWTDGKPLKAAEEHLKAPWNGEANGKRFRCYLCGYKFKKGNTWRWVYSNRAGISNLIVCRTCDCDTEDVLNKWEQMHKELKEAKEKFWWHKF